MTNEIGPEYQRLIALIRSWITAGRYSVGEPIPSTTKLERETGLSRPVVRRAVDQLKSDGILEGHPGKAVYVKALPAVADSEHADLKVVSKEVAGLRRQVADLQERVGRMEATLATVAGKPRGGRREQSRTAADGGHR